MEHEVWHRLRAEMKQDGFDALVALSLDNVTYTAGFTIPSQVSNRFRRVITILAGDRFAAQILVTVEEKLARERSRFSDIRAYNQFTQQPADVLADALIEAGAAEGRIAIELDFMPAIDYIRLVQRLPKARLEECKDIYFRTRMIKTGEEVAALRRIGQITDRVIGEVLREIRPGQTEKDVHRNVWGKMLAAGVDTLKCQVGSGARSGITNCTPTAKSIEAGDVIRVEILGDLDSYRSNLTRTAVLGKPADEQKKIWEVLIRARETCKAMLKPGTPVADVYRSYVKTCRDGGIEPTLKFLGHGIGQTIHEEPYITDTRAIVFQPNITFTMEPLYMIPGRMGFHVEDMYLITPEGYDKITGDITPNDQLIEIG